MRVFNKIVVVVLALVALPVITLFLVLPDQVARVVGETLTALAGRFAAFAQPTRLGLAALALVLDVLLLGLLYLELRRKPMPGAKVMRIQGGEGEITLDAIHQRIQHHVSQLADVMDVRPHVTAKGGRVAVSLDVVTSPHINVPKKIDEVVAVVREAVTGGMGLKLRGRPVVSVRHVSYKEVPPASPPAEAAVSQSAATSPGVPTAVEPEQKKGFLPRLPGRPIR
jgi:hypothetical protein